MRTSDNLIFVADRHGRADLQRAVVNHFGKEANYVFIGDHVDGSPEEPELLKELRDMHNPSTSNVVMGNHEFDRIQAVKAAVMYKEDPCNPDASAWREGVARWTSHRSMGGAALAAYGIEPYDYGDPIDSVLKLYERMQQNKLFDFISSLPLFYEDDQHIAIHAGLTDEPWSQQKIALETAKNDLESTDKIGMDPDQLYSFRLAAQTEAFSATDKVVITGHLPIHETADRRVTANGKRVRLDSNLKCPQSDKIYAYSANDKKVIEVHKEQPSRCLLLFR